MEKEQKLVAEFAVTEIVPIVVVIVVAGIVIVYGLVIQADVREDTACNTTQAYNSSNDKCYNKTIDGKNYNPNNADATNAANDAIDATGKFGDKLGIIVTIIVAVIVIGLLIRYLAGRIGGM